MAKMTYGVGDRIFLLNGPTGAGRLEGEFTIVTCLPDINGMTQYRVKSLAENFERRIIGTDIDTERSPRQDRNQETLPDLATAKGSWLKTSSIKVGK